MSPRSWTKKRERQYDHIKESLEDRGYGKDTSEEIAARTVNKVRAQAGEAQTKSPLSIKDMSPYRRGGQHSHTGAQGPTYDQLYQEARSKNIKGRSKMTKAQLKRALANK
jgi:hypothetical protein